MCGCYVFYFFILCCYYCFVNYCVCFWVCYFWFFEIVVKNVCRRKFFFESFMNIFVYKCVYEWVYIRVGV